MTSLLFHFLLWFINQGSPEQIPARNRTKRAAEAAFQRGDYRLAIDLYEPLSRPLLFPETGILLNLAHAYFHLNDTVQARRYYARLFRTEDPRLASTAWSQAALLQVRLGDTTQAIGFLRQALTLNPDNASAQFNYELLRRRYRLQPAQPPTAPSPQRQPVEPPPASSREVQRSAQRRQTLDRLNAAGLTEAQARQLLDALSATELKYIQQRRRPPKDGPEPEKPW